MTRLLENASFTLVTIHLAIWFAEWSRLWSPEGKPAQLIATVLWIGILATWMLTSIVAVVRLLGLDRLALPRGLFIEALVLTVGTTAFFQGSIIGFVAMFGLTTAVSFVALRAAHRYHGERQAFCYGFAFCCWLGLILTMTSRLPITETLTLEYLCEEAIDRGNVWQWNGASFHGIDCLFLTWLFAFAGGWAARRYIAYAQTKASQQC